MKRILSNALLVFVMLLVLFSVFANVRALAQSDATPEATTVAPSGNVTVNNYQSDPSVTPSAGETPLSLALLLIGSFLVGGAVVGTPLTVVILNLNKTQKDTAEKLFLSQPPANIEKERALIAFADKALTFMGRVVGVVKEITDGQANTDTPAPLSPTAERDMEHG